MKLGDNQKKRFLILFVFLMKEALADEQEYRLTQYLFANYDSSVRPAKNSSLPVDVEFHLLPHKVDLDSHQMTVSCLIKMSWTDAHLNWNSSDFEGISSLRIPAQRVWKPDLVLYKSATSHSASSFKNTNVVIGSSGRVVWSFYDSFTSFCHIKFRYFPFDTQICQMIWASWSYDVQQLNVSLEREVSEYAIEENGDFRVFDFSSEISLHQRQINSKQYHRITYTVILKRNPGFYIYSIILPCICINLQSLLIFCVPSESREKIGVLLSTILSLGIFLLISKDNLPVAQQISLINIYVGATVCFVATSALFAVISLNILYYDNSQREIPRYWKNVLPNSDHGSDIKHSESFEIRPDVADNCNLDVTRVPNGCCDFHTSFTAKNYDIFHSSHFHSLAVPQETDENQGRKCVSSTSEEQILGVLYRIYYLMQRHEKTLVEGQKQTMRKHEWRKVTAYINRILAVCFSVTLVITSIIIFLLLASGT